ncbi:MAG TPA: thiamine phosphate synthase [Methanomassiliicoccales archaeon]|jgi:thiamine-phosphate pyrophosphorylase
MNLGLYVITDEGVSHGLSHVEIARKVAEGGADVIQLRDKARTEKDLMSIALQIGEITRSSGISFIINDRLDLALACGADGVHLGQEDLPLPFARRISPKGFMIGMSVKSVQEALIAESEGADYLALSPIFDTPTKHDAGPGKGLERFREIKSAISIPVIAIGGISKTNVHQVMEAGADGVAVISAVVGQKDISRATAEMRSLIYDHKK